MDIIILIVILLFSAVVHEVSHGLMAEYLGDSTARDEGRITLNPISHIDPFGTILLPVLLYVAQLGIPPHYRVIFGSAKPVPVNFNNLRNPKMGMALVSVAGPLSNFLLALLLVLPIKFGLANQISGPILVQGILINLMLGVFNLIPIPPLDGSKILAAFAPDAWLQRILEFERYGFFLVLIFLYTGILNSIFSVAVGIFQSVTGVYLF